MTDRPPAAARARPPQAVWLRARRRRQHAAAQRRLRQRERDGDLLVTVRLSPQHTTKLHRLKYLDLHEVEDRQRIGAALLALIEGIDIA